MESWEIHAADLQTFLFKYLLPEQGMVQVQYTFFFFFIRTTKNGLRCISDIGDELWSLFDRGTLNGYRAS